MPSSSTPPPAEFQRNALAPAIIASMALLAGIGLPPQYSLVILFIVSILAVIIGWFAIQAKQWWWAVPMLVIAVVWNPLYPLSFSGIWWTGAHIVAAGVFLAAGAMIKSPRKARA